MNMVNFEVTPLYKAYDRIRELAQAEGVGILGSELIGMSPAAALLDCAAHYLKLEDFDPQQVLELRLSDFE